MHIVFITKSVSILGGKEKVLLNLASHFAMLGHTVEIGTYDGSILPIAEIDKRIKIEPLPIAFFLTALPIFQRLIGLVTGVKLCRSFLSQRPHAVIITTDYLISIIVYISKINIRHRLIIWEHLSFTVLKNRFWIYGRQYVYSRAKAIVALNPVEAAFYQSKSCHVTCIPNAIKLNEQINNLHSKSMLWIGSITSEKGIEYVVELAKNIFENCHGITINIFGKGNRQQWLREAIQINNLSGIITLNEETKDISQAFKRAAFLVLTSKHECFPTVILEAFSYGLPVLAFNCPTGPSTMIKNNDNGFLIPMGNVPMLAAKALSLFNNKDLLHRLSDGAFKSANNYAPEKVHEQWKTLLNYAY